MARQFSQEQLRVRPSSREEAVVARAREQFERTLVRVRGQLVGSVAALQHPRLSDAANYGEVFLRDNVPVMIYLLLQGRTDIVRNFLTICLDLQSSSYQTRGVFPTSFVEEANGNLVADYGQRSIGRITSVDASLWWPVLCWLYVQRSRDLDFGPANRFREACSCCWIWCCTPPSRARRCCSCPTAPS
nr:glycoside hydrolase 100 family protein [Synechococcus sp. GFB01]